TVGRQDTTCLVGEASHNPNIVINRIRYFGMVEVRHDRRELANEVTGEVDAVDGEIDDRRAAGEMKVVAVARRRGVAVPALGVDRPGVMYAANEASDDQ